MPIDSSTHLNVISFNTLWNDFAISGEINNSCVKRLKIGKINDSEDKNKEIDNSYMKSNSLKTDS